jgi:Protein of unknown function (DUF2924)
MTYAPNTPFDFRKLQDIQVGELEALWRTHLGGSMPKYLPRFLLSRLLAYRLQIQQSGGLSKTATRFLDQIADHLEAGREPALPYPADQRLKPGSVIVREHEGVEHRVMVLNEGFAWNGKTFGSLSSVAKAITGTNWNGQRFFGLKEKQQPAGEGAA